MKQVILFTTPTCSACHNAKAWLSQRGVPFTAYDLEDVSVQQELRELETKMQRRFQAVPIIVVGTQIFEGFDPAAMEQILEE